MKVAITIISMVTFLTFLFSGLIIFREDIPLYLRWLEYLSIGFYAHQALIHNEFDGLIMQQGTSVVSGNEFLKGVGQDVLSLWAATGYLILTSMLYIGIGMAFFYFRR